MSSDPTPAPRPLVGWYLQPLTFKSLFVAAALAVAVCLVAPALRGAGPSDETSSDHVARVFGAALANAASLLSDALHRPVMLGLMGATLLAALGGVLAGAQRRRLFARASVVAPPARLIDPSTAREAILELAASLRPLVEATEIKMVRFLDEVLQGAIRLGASDLHFQPLETGTNLCLRVGGVLEDVLIIPSRHHSALVRRIKVMARLVTYRSDRPQDGHFVVDSPSGPTDVRVSLLPTSHGEKVVLRVALSGVSVPELAALGLPESLRTQYLGLLCRPQGLIFITGPTGCGKTTTIYGSLGYIKNQRGQTTQIATIEDPIEFDVPSLTQTQVHPETGLSFAQGLRSMLRQDPNVMMVGEIRDAETASIAIQAGLSGHLILTTVHAESAAGVFNRLIEMQVEPFLLASASQASLSQRLVRMLCPHCRRQAAASPAQVEHLARFSLEASAVFEPTGCERCARRGYLGRTAIFELLEVTPALRELINARVPTPQIAQTAAKEGMRSLLVHGLEQVVAGTTSLDEVLRVAG